MRDIEQEIQDMDCKGDFENWRLDEHEDCNCLGCHYSDFCGDKFKKVEQARWDAKTPEERARIEAMVKGLRELY